MQMLQPNSVVVGGIQCEWVPGTMDRVQVHLPTNDIQVSLEQLELLGGLDAVHELYLKGLTFLPYTSQFRQALAEL